MGSTLRAHAGSYLSLALSLVVMTASAGNLRLLAGTWELDVARSKFTPGTEIKSQLRTYQVNGDEVEQSIDSVDPSGRLLHNHSTARYDGKDYPLDDNPDANTIVVEQSGDLTTVTKLKKDGAVVQTVTRTLAADGKTFAIHYEGRNSKGSRIDNLLYFNKR
jgi:hypothetical protein